MQVSRTIRFLVFAAALAVVLAPSVARAEDFFPIVTCGTERTNLCTPCDLFATVKRVIDFILFGITGPIAAFMVVFSGALILLGGTSPNQLARGKLYLKNTLIGVTIILVSWLAVNFLIKTLARGNAGDRWYEFSCPPGLANIVNLTTEFASGGAQPPALPPVKPSVPGSLTASPVGVRCKDDSLGRCATAKPNGDAFSCVDCTNSAQMDDTIAKEINDALTRAYQNDGGVMGGIPRSTLLAIMYAESSCRFNPPPSGAGAYGLMQIKPATAAKHAGPCNVNERIFNKETGKWEAKIDPITGAPIPARINAGLLTNKVYADKVICMAVAELRALQGACGNDTRNIAAGYNGGPGACGTSISCGGSTSCGGGPTRRWECAWEDRAHLKCNADRPGGGYTETRAYAPKVAACAQRNNR